MTSPSGPAAQLLELASRGDILLFVSACVLDELRVVTSRPRIVAKYGLEATAVTGFLTHIGSFASCIVSIPHVFEFPRDPDDAHYVDLALAVDAKLIVSRDKDLLSLRDEQTPEGRDFMRRYPTLVILTPPEALQLLASRTSPD